MRNLFIFVLCGLSMCLGATLVAAEAQLDQALEVDTLESFVAKQQRLRNDLETSKHPSVTNKNKARILAAQDVIFSKLSGKSDLAELSDGDFAEVVNQQELIVGILSNSEDDRLICRREVRVGSFFDKTVCISKRERMRQYRETERGLQELIVMPDASREVGAEARAINKATG